MIGFKRHLEKYGNTYADWDTASPSDAQQLLASITNFEFIIVFLTVYQYLSHLAGITVKLQKQALDILEAHQQIAEISRVYTLERQNVDSGFAKIFEHACRITNKVGSTVAMPRIALRQQHRSNAPAISPCEYFQRNVAIPLLDHIIMFIDQQFSGSFITAVKLLGLVPSILCSSKPIDLGACVNQYSSDLPSLELFEMEIHRWKNRYLPKQYKERP